MCTEGHGNRQATAASVPPRPSQIQGADGMGGVGLGNKHERRNHWKIIENGMSTQFESAKLGVFLDATKNWGV